MPFNDETLRQIVVLIWASIIAGLAWLARKLIGGWDMSVWQAVGGFLGALVASFSFGALSLTIMQVPDLFLLGAAGPVGWMGAEALKAMAKGLEKRTGINISDE